MSQVKEMADWLFKPRLAVANIAYIIQIPLQVSQLWFIPNFQVVCMCCSLILNICYTHMFCFKNPFFRSEQLVCPTSSRQEKSWKRLGFRRVWRTGMSIWGLWYSACLQAVSSENCRRGRWNLRRLSLYKEQSSKNVIEKKNHGLKCRIFPMCLLLLIVCI